MGFSKSQQLKEYMGPLLSAMRDFSERSVKKQIEYLFVPDCHARTPRTAPAAARVRSVLAVCGRTPRAVCGNDSKRKSKSEKSQSVTDVAGAVVELTQAAVLLYDQACALVETKVRVRCAYAAELLTHSFTSRDLRFTPSHVYHLRVPCTQFASMRRSAIT